MSTKRQQDYIHEDIFRLLNPDCNRAFSSFEDAVDRLLPFHVSLATWTSMFCFSLIKLMYRLLGVSVSCCHLFILLREACESPGCVGNRCLEQRKRKEQISRRLRLCQLGACC